MKGETQHSFTGELLRAARKHGLEHLLLRKPLVLGVSGGADSLAMMFALLALRGEQASSTLHVAHLDHGFRGEQAVADADFVEQLAREHNLPFTRAFFDVPHYAAIRGLADEDAARRARYAFLAGVATQIGGTITVAHTADDQAETVLMHLLRGSGTAGLTGMKMLGAVPITQDDAELRSLLGAAQARTAEVFRPLLRSTRESIETYVATRGVQPRIDATNYDMSYQRNTIRHSLLPTMQSFSPAIKLHLRNLADIASAEDDLLAEMTESTWRDVVCESVPSQCVAVDIERWPDVPLALRRRLIRRALWLLCGSLDNFTFGHIEAADSILSGYSSARSQDLPRGVRVERKGRKGVLYTAQAKQVDPSLWPQLATPEEQPLEPGAVIKIGAGWTLAVALTTAEGAAKKPGEYTALFDWDELQRTGTPTLRTHKTGDWIQPLGMEGRKSLQDLFVDAKIPREAREWLPVIALLHQSAVLWVPGSGGRRSDIAPITPNTRTVLQLAFGLKRWSET